MLSEHEQNVIINVLSCKICIRKSSMLLLFFFFFYQ